MINSSFIHAYKKRDEYYTPRILVNPILPYIPRDKVVWCPFDTKNSEFVRAFKARGNEVVYGHIREGLDFFAYEPEHYDYIVSNPPFTRKLDVLTRLYALNKPFAMLLPLPMLNYQEVGNFFVGKQIELLIVDKKVSFDGNTSSFNTSFFCKGVLPRELIFCSLEHNNSNSFYTASRMYKDMVDTSAPLRSSKLRKAKMSNSKLLVIDGSYYLHRNFHALPPTYNSAGEPTWAARGATHSIQRSLQQINPTHVVITFDMGGETFRHRIYPAYKSDRPPAAPELTAQRDPLIQVLKAMGLCVIAKEGIEADDIMGTIAHKASQYGMTVVISTGDKDMCQMVDERTTLFNPFTKSKQVTDEEGVFTKYGVYPHNFADLLALIGDNADSIPGVNGFGVKTASALLRTWGTIENMVEHRTDIDGAAGAKFRANAELALMCKRLTTIKKDLSLGLTLKQLLRGSIEAEKLRVLRARLEFTQHKSLFGENVG